MGSRKRIKSAGHQGGAVPALLKTTFNQLAAYAAPTLLRHVLKVMKQLARPPFLHGMGNPDFGQTLVRRHAAGRSGQKFALHAGGYAFNFERICPERGDGQVRGLCQAQHKPLAYAQTPPAGPRIMSALDHVDFSTIQ